MAELISVANDDGHNTDAYLASAPTNAGGGVVIVHEIEGITPHFGSLCDRLAEQGYSAIAPDLFSRDPGIREAAKVWDIPTALGKVYALGAERWLADLAAAREVLVDRCDVDPARVAVLGFCFGGYVALLGATDPAGGWAAAAPFYGPPAGYGAFGMPQEPNPLARAAQLSCPARLFYGRDDDHIPLDDAVAFTKSTGDAGHQAELVVEEAGHAFFNDSRDTYQPAAAAHAWTELVSFLGATLQEAK